MPIHWQLFDRIRGALRAANIFRTDNLYQDQDSLDRVVSGGNFLDLSKQSALLEQTNLQINRLERYKDYDMMDEVGEITLALDMYADESSLADPERKHSVIVKAKNLRVKEVIEDLLYNTLMIDSQIRPITRYLCKYGDFPAEIVPTKNRDGVASFRFIPVYNFTRIQTKFGDLVGFYYQDPASAQPVFLHPWQVMHMRLTTFETVYHPYGRCAIQGTKVQTPTGERVIEDLRSGNEVYCFDGRRRLLTSVIDLVNNGMKMVHSVHTAERRLDLTAQHPVMLLGDKELVYKTVGRLKEGDRLIVPQDDGTVQVEGISRIEKRDRKQVFDIGVESPHHNFIANGAVIHNSVLDGGRKDFKRLRLMEDAALVYRICVRGDTRVSTPDGYKQVRDVEVGETAFCLDRDIQQQPTKIINKVCNGKDKIYRVFSRHREIFANSTHPILVVSPYKENGVVKHDRLEYVDVKDLKTLANTRAKHYCHRFLLPRIENQEPIELEHPEVPVYVALTDPVSISESTLASCSITAKAFLTECAYIKEEEARAIVAEVPNANAPGWDYKRGWCYDLPQRICRQYEVPSEADEDFARWFGFMIGDGYVSTRVNSANGIQISQVGFALGDDREINEQYKRLFKKMVGEVSFGQDEDHRLGSYYVYSRHFVDFMLMNGFVQGAKNKRIPAWVYRSPRNIQIAFVDGYLDADGNSRYFKGGVTEGHTIECCNAQLVEDFKELIDRMGWTAGLVTHREKKGSHVIDKQTGRTMPDTEAWVLYFTKEELPEYERILGVEEAGEDLVYDVTVENDVHNVIYNGIYTHQTRAPEKRIFSIPVGNIPVKEVPQYMELVARGFKKVKFVDPATGQVNERYNPLIQDDDFFLPKRPDGTGPTIDTLPGAENLDAIADIEYFKKKMVAGLKIPFSRVGIGDPAEPNGKSLAQISPEFAKNIQWIQREVVTQLKKMTIVHLALRGHSMEEIRNFDLYMTAASAIDELYRIEVWNTRTDIIGNLKETGLFPDEWILERFTDMSGDEIKQMQLQKAAKQDVERMKAESKNSQQATLLEEYSKFLDRVASNDRKRTLVEFSNVAYLVNQKELDGLPRPGSTNGSSLLVQNSVPSVISEAVKKEVAMMLEGAEADDEGVVGMIAEGIEDEPTGDRVLMEQAGEVIDAVAQAIPENDEDDAPPDGD